VAAVVSLIHGLRTEKVTYGGLVVTMVTKDVIPLQQYHDSLMTIIDDLEWDSEFELADMHKKEIEYVKAQIEKGELWHPLF